MERKPIKTKIWTDGWFASLSKEGKILFLYLLTNIHMGFTGYAEIPQRVMLFESSLNENELETAKKELSKKVLFRGDWLYIVNYLKHDPIKGGEKNNIWTAYEKELELVPTNVKESLKGLIRGLEGTREGKGMVGKGRESKALKELNTKRKALGIVKRI